MVNSPHKPPMHTQQRDRAHTLLQSRSIQRALFASPYNVTWLTGFATSPHMGLNPFVGAPPLVYYDSGKFTLIITDVHGTDGVNIPIIRYGGYTVEHAITSADDVTNVVRDLFGNSITQLWAETRHVPAFLLPPVTLALDGLLDPLRMVKTAEEIEKMRRAYALTDTAHAAARKAVAVGVSEIEVWNAAHSASEQAAGGRVPFGNDCVLNTREGNIGGLPGNLVMKAGDSIMVDLSARVDGYWSDSCMVYYATEPDEKQAAMHRTAGQALAFAISLIKPGVIANDIDRQVRKFIADAGYPVYPHHTGHGIGTSTHEEPRIVPYNTTPLEAGMVIMLEPGTYFPTEAAARLEDAVLVTPTGAEVLTKHDKSM
jgi:Xaa-Pro dipeptidase